MHGTERCITLRDIINENAQCANIEYVLEPAAFALHLSPDAVDVFRPAAYLSIDAVLEHLAVQLRLNQFDEGFALNAFFVQRFRDRLVSVWLQVAKGQILKLPLQLPDTEPACQRRVDFLRFNGDLTLFADIGCLGETQSIQLLGNSYQYQSSIGDNGEQHLSQRFGLMSSQCLSRLPVRRQREFPKLHQSSHEIR